MWQRNKTLVKTLDPQTWAGRIQEKKKKKIENKKRISGNMKYDDWDQISSKS